MTSKLSVLVSAIVLSASSAWSADLVGSCVFKAATNKPKVQKIEFRLKPGQSFYEELAVTVPIQGATSDEYHVYVSHKAAPPADGTIFHTDADISLHFADNRVVCDPPVLTPIGQPPAFNPCARPEGWALADIAHDEIKTAKVGDVVKIASASSSMSITCSAQLQ